MFIEDSLQQVLRATAAAGVSAGHQHDPGFAVHAGLTTTTTTKAELKRDEGGAADSSDQDGATSASARSLVACCGSSGNANAERLCPPLQHTGTCNLPRSKSSSSVDQDNLAEPSAHVAAVAAAQRALGQRDTSVVLIGTILDPFTAMVASSSTVVSTSSSSSLISTTSSSSTPSSTAASSSSSASFLPPTTTQTPSSSASSPISTSPTLIHTFSLTGIETVVPTYPPFTTASSTSSSSSHSRSTDSALAVKLSLGLGIPFAILLILLSVILLHRRQKRIVKTRRTGNTHSPLDFGATPEMAVVSQADFARPQPPSVVAALVPHSARDSARGSGLLGPGNEAGRASKRAYRTSSMYSSDMRPQALNLPLSQNPPSSSTKLAVQRQLGPRNRETRSSAAAMPPPPPSWMQQWPQPTSGPGGPLSSNPALDLTRQSSFSSSGSSVSITTTNRQHPSRNSYTGHDVSHHYLLPYQPGQWRPAQVSPIQEVSSLSAQQSIVRESPVSLNGQSINLRRTSSPHPPESPVYPYLTPYGRLDYWLPSPTEAHSLGGSRSSVPEVQVSDSDAESQRLPIQHPPPLVTRPHHLAVDVHAVQGGLDEVSPLSSSGSGLPHPERISVVSGLSPIDRRGIA
ncbi:hypothetical protein BD289DRAFT_485536 [Coniella lustricola]|uniref:Uncharacterized protein n=1 Tax=Coniella lustricola TaxID=2025994 RepID=A0A2T2ZYC8_9PEZI|nr:hypothetical protein BD289DRAFT_485536 [Coniella lustricola]